MKNLDKKIVVTIAIVLVALLQAAFAGAMTLSRFRSERNLDAARQSEAGAKEQVELLRHQLELQSPGTGVAWQLLDSPDVAGTLGLLQTLGDNTGVMFGSAKASPSSTKGKQSYLVTGTGLPEQVCAFAAAIETCDRLLVIENGRLLPAASDKIGFEFGISTFQRGGGR